MIEALAALAATSLLFPSADDDELCERRNRLLQRDHRPSARETKIVFADSTQASALTMIPSFGRVSQSE